MESEEVDCILADEDMVRPIVEMSIIALKPIPYHEFYTCPHCHKFVYHEYIHCSKCSQLLDWSGVK